MNLPHHIGRITVNLKVPDAEKARDLQQEVSTLCRTEVQAKLSELFDEMAGNRVIRLDRLEVVLDPFKDLDAFRRNFVSDLAAGIQENLQEVLDRPPSVRDMDKAPGADLFAAEWKSADLFLNVIEHGSAPWTSGPDAFDHAVKEVPDLLSGSREFREALKQILKGSSAAVKRLAMQFEPPSLHRIIGALTQLRVPWIFEVQKAVEKLFDRFEPGSQVYLKANYAIIEAAIYESGNEDLFATSSLTAALKMILPALPFALDDQKRFLAAARDVSEEFPGKLQHLFLNAIGDSTEINAFRPAHDQNAVELFEQDTMVHDDLHGMRQEDERSESSLDGNDLELSPDFPVDSGEHDAYQNTIDTGSPMHTEKQFRSKVKEETGKDFKEPKKPLYPEMKTREKMGEDAEDVHKRLPDTHGDFMDNDDSYDPLAYDETRGENRTKGISVQAEHGKLGRRALGEHKNIGKGLFPESGPGENDFIGRAPRPSWLTPPMETFHIHNAGLVLLAPFFRSVFKDLNYLNKDNKFVDDRAQARAIHLTQFLVTGGKYPAESDLVLNKILCGLEKEEPLERFLSLNEKEEEVAMDLLLSAIGHWKSLKKTSAPVFRQTFLRHFGILDKKGETWRLRIERTAIDVLIDTLPWTISVIKQPWMNRPVMVEW